MDYRGYFKTQYKASFIKDNIKKYRSWFYTQWKFINKHLNIGENKRILEVGSGFGGFYSFLKNNSYIGLELDKDAVKFTNKNFNTNCFLNQSIEEFQSNNKFDCIFAFEVLEHLANPLESLYKIFTLLEEKGVFCATSPYPFYKNIVADHTHMYVLHPANWKKLFKIAGFKSVKIYPMSFFPFLWRINRQLNFRLPFYISFPGFISTALIIAKK